MVGIMRRWSRRGIGHRAMVESRHSNRDRRGRVAQGRQVGKGSQIWPTGRYDGEIANGLPNGRGVLILQRLRYEGEFRDGKPNGIGTLTVGSDSARGTWKDGCLQGGQRRASIGVPLSACR